MGNYIKNLGGSLLYFAFTSIALAQPSNEVCDVAKYESLFHEKAKLLINDSVFQTLSYEEVYKNLEELYENSQNSESASKVKKLTIEFIKKLKIEYKVTESKEEFFQRISDNITSTSFKTIEEAISKYNEYLEASCEHYANSEEFWVYAYMAIDKFGRKIFTDAVLKYNLVKNDQIPNQPMEYPDRDLELDIKYFTPQPEEKP
jgi:adenylate kinase family enzyme